jgi:DNA-binding transcriptional MerR regulator
MAALRMRDVMEQTGLSRQAIHFYVEQGLVDPPHKTGATSATYTQAHVERIKLIRKLQDEHFLPLKAIRAMLDDESGGFTRAQQQVLRDVRARLPAATTRAPEAADVPLAPLLARTGLGRADVKDLERRGVIEVVRGKVTADDAWVIELWGEVRRAGFTRDLVGAEVLVMMERGVERIFEDEKQILGRMIAARPAAQVAELIERALPLIHAYLVRLHETKVRALFANLEQPS